MKFRRCDECGSIAIFVRTASDDDPKYACQEHRKGDGWAFVCSVDGCTQEPLFRVEYRISGSFARITVCPLHFQILPDDRFDAFIVD